MGYKVFFAFQMDIDDKFGKGFIQTAIEVAIQKFKSEGIDVSLDFGFRGTSGTPLLIEEMLKKSSESDMVIVDLTFTSSKIWSDSKKISAFGKEIRILNNTQDKKSPNPNVLLETGYAWAKKGTYRTLVVMNSAFGSPDLLPVDLKGFRWGITYNLNESNYEVRKTIRKELATDLYEAIKASINSETTYQREKWRPFKLHQDWKCEEFYNQYIPTGEIKDIITKLRIALEKAGNPQRLVGPKNSGKTRLAYELYRNVSPDLEKDESIERVLYYDIELTGYASIEKQILDLALLNQDKVVIIDNCDTKIHKKICDDLLLSNVRILTIDEYREGETSQRATVNLTTEIAVEVVRVSLNKKFTSKTATSLIQNSQGNVREALAYVNSSLTDGLDLSKTYETKWKQILGEDIYEKGGLIVLEAVSAFKYIGISDKFKKQGEFVASDLCNGMDYDKFVNIVQAFIERGMIKQQGDFIILETFVEELSMTWWRKQSNGTINDLLKGISIAGLSKQLSDRLIELSRTESKNEILQVITGGSGILSDYNFINTDQGAKIIHGLVEIIPELIIETLTKSFEGKSTAELQKFEAGRRYMVWALEKLVFRKETFNSAAKLLFRMALAENENIGNNATAQFIHLFQPYLAGTEVNLNERYKLIQELEDRSDVNKMNLLLSCCQRALSTGNFVRKGGSEIQAGVELIDYAPTDEERNNYYKLIIEYLTTII